MLIKVVEKNKILSWVGNEKIPPSILFRGYVNKFLWQCQVPLIKGVVFLLW
ncbi:MAG: hypothetical protein K0S61_897 [Anaerocolumna sp.]|jgi:hypothetical protein|nr:hypothetical protein [Anaerocolumna sp.]